MKTFNINDHIYIQITEAGWNYLRKTVDEEYIKHCIDSNGHRVEIDGVIWHKLHAHEVFGLLPVSYVGEILFKTNIMFDDKDLK